MTERLRLEIRRWIENEQVLCGFDSGYWETRYAYVCNEEGQIYKYQPRMSQRILDSVISEFDEKQVSIELLILKGRQLGVTSWTATKFIRRMLFLPHTQAIMASVKASSSQLIGRILDTEYNKCPFWLVPLKTPRNSFANGSILSIQSGMQATGLAQGWTPTCVHVSEIADLSDAKKTIEEGLFRATHSSKNLFMVLEGTGGGSTGWLADTWRSAKEDWPKGLSRLCPVFVPWPMCPEIYPERDWLRKFPVENSWRPHETTRKHVARCESYIRNTPYLAKIAGANWRMPIEQQWFWQFNYDTACKNHTQKTWAAQMPADDFESLTGVHDSVFDPEVMQEVEEYVYEIKTEPETGLDVKTRRVPIQAYIIQGESIDEDFIIDDSDPRIDWSKPVIQVSWKNHRGTVYEWEMIPALPFDEEKEINTFGLLLVYEEPKAGYDYSCGVDTASGLGDEDEDRTVISMERNRFGSDFDYQVAEFTSNAVNSAQAVGFAACTAAYYGERTKDHRGVKFAIEQITRPGDTCQNQLKMMGFNHHHKPRRYDSKKVKDDTSKKEGWYSSGWSVPILMTRFIQAVNDGWYRPASKWLIEELRTLERHVASGGKEKMEHREGQHDDRVRAAAQGYFTVHDLDNLAERAQKRYALPARKKAVKSGRCTTNEISIGGDE